MDEGLERGSGARVCGMWICSNGIHWGGGMLAGALGHCFDMLIASCLAAPDADG